MAINCVVSEEVNPGIKPALAHPPAAVDWLWHLAEVHPLMINAEPAGLKSLRLGLSLAPLVIQLKIIDLSVIVISWLEFTGGIALSKSLVVRYSHNLLPPGLPGLTKFLISA